MDEIKQTAQAAEAPESDAGSTELYDNESIASAFLDEGSGADETAADASEGQPAPSEEAQGEANADEAEAAPEPTMPDGWEETMWQAATPEIRAKVAEQAQAHAAALAKEIQVRQQVLQEREQFTIAANAQIQQALSTMRQVVEGEFRQVDWNGLANSDPAAYVQLQRMYNDRMGAIQQIQRNVAAQVQAMQQARAVETQRQMKAEFETAEPVVKALIGAGYEGKKFAREVASYLQTQGVPVEAINNITRGYELTMAVKAMLYDRLAASRASAAKKVAEAPKVQAPSGSKGGEGGERFKKAMAALKQHPSSTDAIASVFENL